MIVFFLLLCYPTVTNQNRKEFPVMLEYRYDTQLLIEGEDLDEDEMMRFLSESFYNCPYWRNGDEYAVVRKQN